MNEPQAEKPAVKTAPKPAVKTAPEAPVVAERKNVRHVVLKEKRGQDWHPLLSCEHDDPAADDLIAAEKIERINTAKRAGGPIPAFHICQEVGGKEVSPL